MGYKCFCKRARCLRFTRFSCNLLQIGPDASRSSHRTWVGDFVLSLLQTLGSLRLLTHSRSLALFCTIAFFLFRGFWKSLYIPSFTSYGTANSHLPLSLLARLPLVTSRSRAVPSPICLCLSCSSRLEGSSVRKFRVLLMPWEVWSVLVLLCAK